ncbi:MAG TPA: hypothetical protein VMF03_01450 [Steroidobacteraceae bacterium]|nr:hypothetical protein [Steroidobacteraceae bacterium]
MQVKKRAIAQAAPFQLSLHVRHPSVDPEEISRELSLEAVESFRAGEPRESRSGLAATAVHGETYWVAVVDPMGWSAPAMLARRMPAREIMSSLLPQEAKVLRTRFGLDEAETTPGSLGWGIVLICHCLSVRHRGFMKRLREQGGSLTLLAAIQPEALIGLRITPEMGRQMHDLGLTVNIEPANSRDSNPDLN